MTTHECGTRHQKICFAESKVVAISNFVRYDTLLKNAPDIVTKCESYFIKNCDKSLLQIVTVLLQNATVIITKCGF